MNIQKKFDLTGRVAVVTGGVGLLGAEFCRTLAEAGASIVVVDLDASASQATADTLKKNGHRALAVPADITRPDSVNALVEKVLAEFGRLDILVNSAALDPKFDAEAVKKGMAPGAFEDYPLDQWNRGDERQPDRHVPRHTGVRQADDRAGQKGKHHQHLLHLRAERSRPAHLRQGRSARGVQAGLLHGDQGGGDGLYQIPRRLLRRDGDPRQRAHTRRRVQQPRGLFREELLRQDHSRAHGKQGRDERRAAVPRLGRILVHDRE
jgi:hypothetical protein